MFKKSSAGKTITQSELPKSKPCFIASHGPARGFFTRTTSKLYFLNSLTSVSYTHLTLPTTPYV